MNIYIASPRSEDVELVADRLMDQNVSSVKEERDTNVFSMFVHGCQIDPQAHTWKSNIASSQLMEKMDYEDNTDDTDGYHDNTAKKCRLSSYESSTASLQSVQSSSSSFNPASSQVYTGNFESTPSEEQRRFINLNIFTMPWNTNVSSEVHRLFIIPTAIHIVVINTEACSQKDYKEECLKMLDSIWAFSKGKDKMFPKVIVAATTFAKDIQGDITADIASLFSSWIMGKPYEYECQKNLDHVFVLSTVLRNDQTRELKTFIFGLLEKFKDHSSERESLTEELDALRKSNTKIIARNSVGIRHMSSTEVEKRLLEMHDRKEILYLYGMTPKWVVLDPEFLILSLEKILKRTYDNEQITFFKEMDLTNILRSKKDAPLIDIMCHVGFLGKSVHSHTNENIFVISACPKTPVELESLSQLPSQNDSPHVNSPILCIQFNELPLVSCAFQMIICQLLKRFPYDSQGRRCLMFNNFAAFKLSKESNTKQRLCVFTDKLNIFIYIIKYTTDTVAIDPTFCGQIRNLVESTMTALLEAEVDNCFVNTASQRTNDIVTREKREIEYEYLIRCPETKNLKITEEGLISVKELKDRADTEGTQNRKIYHCFNHSDRAHPHGVDVQSLLNSWFPETYRSQGQGRVPGQTDASAATPSIVDFGNQASEIKVNAKIAGKIADCIGQRWQMLALELGVDQSSLDKITYNNPRDVDKAITDMLMHCVNKRNGELTLKEVEQSIRNVGVNNNWDKFYTLYIPE